VKETENRLSKKGGVQKKRGKKEGNRGGGRISSEKKTQSLPSLCSQKGKSNFIHHLNNTGTVTEKRISQGGGKKKTGAKGEKSNMRGGESSYNRRGKKNYRMRNRR